MSKLPPLGYVPPKPDDFDDLNKRGQSRVMRPVTIGLAIDPRSEWWLVYHDVFCVECGHTGASHDCEDGNCEAGPPCPCRMFVAPATIDMIAALAMVQLVERHREWYARKEAEAKKAADGESAAVAWYCLRYENTIRLEELGRAVLSLYPAADPDGS